MDKIADLNNYHDLQGLAELKARVTQQPDDKQALRQAAQQFESIFIGMLLKSMRDANAVFEEGNPMNSNTTRFFRDMYDQQLATDMSSKGSLGLADLIVQQLSPDPTYKPASILRNDSHLERQQFANAPKPTSDNNPSTIMGEFNDIIKHGFGQAGLQVSNDAPAAVSVSKKQKAPAPQFDAPEDFVSTLWDYAKKAASKIGINPAVMIAQSALETGWGKYIIKDKQGGSSFNLFNIKAHRDWEGEKAAQSTLEFEQGVAVRKVEPFRVYNNFSHAFDDFVNFLKSNGRYQQALDSANDSEQFLQNLQKAGYATDPNYADKILTILKSDKFKDMISQLGQSTVNNIGA